MTLKNLYMHAAVDYILGGLSPNNKKTMLNLDELKIFQQSHPLKKNTGSILYDFIIIYYRLRMIKSLDSNKLRVNS